MGHQSSGSRVSFSFQDRHEPKVLASRRPLSATMASARWAGSRTNVLDRPFAAYFAT